MSESTFPPDLQTVRLTFGPYWDAGGKPSRRSIRVEPPTNLLDVASGGVVFAGHVAMGRHTHSVDLPASDAATVSPRGFTYAVTLGRDDPRYVYLPADLAEVDFDTLIPSEEDHGVVWYPAEMIDGAVPAIVEARDEALGQISDALGGADPASGALGDIAAARSGALTDIGTARSSAVSAVEDAASVQIGTITTARDEAVAARDAAGQHATDADEAATTAGTRASEAGTARDEAVQARTDATQILAEVEAAVEYLEIGAWLYSPQVDAAGVLDLSGAEGQAIIHRRLTADITSILLPADPVPGQTLQLTLVQDGVGGRQVTASGWAGSGITAGWGATSRPMLTGTPDSIDMWHITWDGVRWVHLSASTNIQPIA